MSAAVPETANQAEFARIARVKPGYVTQLKRDGRLVMSEDGKRVNVRESLERIAATRDPSKAGVAARHAANRAQATQPATTAPAQAGDRDVGDDAADDDDFNLLVRDSDFARRRARALAVKEEFLAKQAEREHDIAVGKLRVGADVEAAAAAAVTEFRTRVEALPDLLAPQLVVISDEAQMRGTLAEAFEQVLGELERRFALLAKGVA